MRSAATILTKPYDKAPIALAGSHQKQNAALAVAALRAAKIDAKLLSDCTGLAAIDWPARFQRWDERTIVDGAHNPAAGVRSQKHGAKILVISAPRWCAVLSDKDLRGICEALAPISEFVLLPKIRSERAADPEEVARALANITPPLPYSIVQSVDEALALARAKPNPILITGSLHFAGEVLALLRGEPATFEECTQ